MISEYDKLYSLLENLIITNHPETEAEPVTEEEVPVEERPHQTVVDRVVFDPLPAAGARPSDRQLEREREQQRLQQQVPLDDASRRRRPSCLACRRPLTLLRGRLKSSSGSCKRPQRRQRASKLKLLPLRQSSRRRLLPPQGRQYGN
jgi:hypothetical protein